MRSIIIFLILILIGLQYKLWISDSSIPQWIALEKKLQADEVANQQLAARNAVVEANIVELKSGDQALEEEARFELGMIKEGEVYYQFID